MKQRSPQSIQYQSLEKTFEQYTVLNLIALGSGSEVLRVKNNQNQLYAIKHLLPPNKYEDWMQDALYKEGLLLQSLQHPQIPKCYDIICDQTSIQASSHLLLLEHLPTLSLRQLLYHLRIQHAYLPLNTVVYILVQIYQVLEYIHQHPEGAIHHNDLSPANILIDEQGKIYLIDFSSASTEYCPKQSKAYQGKTRYQSPERKQTPYKGSRESDYFSWGMIAFELIIGAHFQYKHFGIDTHHYDAIVTSYQRESYIEKAVHQQWPELLAQLTFTALHPNPRIRSHMKEIFSRQRSDIYRMITHGTQEQLGKLTLSIKHTFC